MLRSDPVNKIQPEDTELWAMAVLESTVDAVRFRVDGLRPDTLQERPVGFALTMVDVISALRRGEQAYNAAMRQAVKQDAPTLNTDFTSYPRIFIDRPFSELGDFLHAREFSLGVLRNLPEAGWNRTINDPERGTRTLEALTVERAHNDRKQLALLEQMRHVMVQTTRPADRSLTGGDRSDSTR